MSEDCLYLNIWTAARKPGDHLPVLVWVHGGGFVVGSGSSKEDDGENLARQGLVVVTCNYRLGVFGFLAHPDLTRESPHHSSGNYGLLDQIAVLRWVRHNIAAFGGDPNNVTFAGQSAGATSIGYLLVSPLAHGLFQRAIVESPARLFVPAPELKKSFQGLLPAEDIGSAMGRHIGEMRRWNSNEVMQRAQEAMKRLFPPQESARSHRKPAGHPYRGEGDQEPWWAFVDGWVVPQQIARSYAENKEIVVPLLAGTNANEGSIFVTRAPATTEQGYCTYLKETFAPCAKAMFRLYPASDPAEIRAQAERIYTDAYFLYGARSLAQAERRKESKVFLYKFTRVGPDARLAKLGAWHGSELAYVFGHVRSSPSRNFNAKDQEISEEMIKAWTRFAATGDPNTGSVPAWPAWSNADEAFMVFGDSSSVRSIRNAGKFGVFSQAFSVKPDRDSGCQLAPVRMTSSSLRQTSCTSGREIQMKNGNAMQRSPASSVTESLSCGLGMSRYAGCR